MNLLKVVLAEKNIQSKWISEQLGVSRATVRCTKITIR